MNPYWDTNFFQFFIILFKRLTGQLPLATNITSDETQLLVLIAISISTGLLGTFLTLRKMTMLANSLSHTTLLGIVVCFLLTLQTSSDLDLNIPLLLVASIVSAFLTLLITEGVHHFFKLQEDAAIGLVFTTLFALGIVLVTLFTRSSHMGVEVITGNVDALGRSDIYYTIIVALINLLATCLAYRPWALSAFDPQLAASSGCRVTGYHYLQMVLTALTLVVSIRAVGVLLVLAFLVGPTLIARHYVTRLAPLLFTTLAIGVGFSLCGVALSRHLLSTLHLSLSTGGLTVTLLSLGYFLSAIGTFRRSSCF
jgi:manganese/zinc/iron transport system permease protein